MRRAICLLLLLSCAFASACSPSDARIEVVEELLKLRAASSGSVADYRRYVVSDDLASALAQADAASKAVGKGSPIPEWETVYIAESADTTAAVVVLWEADDTHPDWPSATVFVLELDGQAWHVSDAREVGEAERVPPRLSDRSARAP